MTDETPPIDTNRFGKTLDPQFDLALFGPAPLLAGDDPGQYMALFRSTSTTVQPVDIFERSSVRHITDLMWEMRRYRRMITQLIGGAAQPALEKILQRFVPTVPLDQMMFGTTKAQELARGYALKEETATTEVNSLLKAGAVTWDQVQAEAVGLRASEIERLNRLVINAAARVNSTLRELERRRADLAKRLRRAVAQAEAADAGGGSTAPLQGAQVDTAVADQKAAA